MRNPRIQVSLSPKQKAVIQTLADARGTSSSKVVSELVDAAMPVFEKLATVLTAAHAAKSAYSSEIKAGIDKAAEQVEGYQETALQVLEAMEKKFRDEVH